MFYLNLFKMNFRSNYEYKKNFYIQVVTMLLNNVFFLGYWIMFFDIFKSDIFSLIDIFYVYSVVYVAFGLTQLIAGNLPNIATIIATGQLDIYLIKPRNSLLYMIMSKSSIVALGDIIYGLIALSVTLVKTSEYLFILLLYWLLLVVLVVTVIASYYIILGSLTFFIGNSKAITDTGTSALIMFATYPQVKLNPTMTLVLSTIIPSLIISIFPLQILRYSSSYYLLLLFIATAVFLLLSLVTYKQGLKRYESSNSINLNV
ncbi:hypothetical protein BFR38_04835 [Brochothrix thermosphacta]|nr:hypothetical protein BFR38_04835 [Brochothrix thermosphacta]ODJ61858.1 hypothetical protein BFR42_00720 [Brochothrix thermosphacta]SLM94033.1 ABC-type multidrug transport system, permease component [Brachybacterium faecium]